MRQGSSVVSVVIMRVVATKEGGVVDVRGHTLVLPGAGSLAHLGELCTDAVVTTFGLGRVAVVHSRHMLPMVSASAWAAPGEVATAQGGSGLALTTAAELYQNAAVPRLTVLQLRSLAAEGRRRAVAEEILQWAREAGVAEIVIVSACSAHVKDDGDLAAPTELRFVRVPCGGDLSDVASIPQGLDGAPLPILPLGYGRDALPESTEDADGADSLQPLPFRPPFPKPGSAGAAQELLRGGGLARSLLTLTASSEAGPSVVCLLGLTSEAVDWQLTERLAKVVCMCLASKVGVSSVPAFTAPPSWQFEAEATAPQLWG